MMHRSRLLAVTLCLLLDAAAVARAQTPVDPWRDWRMVVGDWIGDEGHGQPGSPTSSSFSFAPELDGKILTRRDRSDYPVFQGRPAFTHAGLMVIYRDEASGAFRAQSFDNEGHVIEYSIEVVPATRIVFTSPAKGGAPGYRLVYETVPAGLAIRFEIAPPNDPSAFALYVAGSAHRR